MFIQLTLFSKMTEKRSLKLAVIAPELKNANTGRPWIPLRRE
jgi:hypothetical protein